MAQAPKASAKPPKTIHIVNYYLFKSLKLKTVNDPSGEFDNAAEAIFEKLKVSQGYKSVDDDLLKRCGKAIEMMSWLCPKTSHNITHMNDNALGNYIESIADLSFITPRPTYWSNIVLMLYSLKELVFELVPNKRQASIFYLINWFENYLKKPLRQIRTSLEVWMSGRGGWPDILNEILEDQEKSTADSPLELPKPQRQTTLGVCKCGATISYDPATDIYDRCKRCHRYQCFVQHCLYQTALSSSLEKHMKAKHPQIPSSSINSIQLPQRENFDLNKCLCGIVKTRPGLNQWGVCSCGEYWCLLDSCPYQCLEKSVMDKHLDRKH